MNKAQEGVYALGIGHRSARGDAYSEKRKGGRHGCHEHSRSHEGGGRASSLARLTAPGYPAPAPASYYVAVKSSPGGGSIKRDAIKETTPLEEACVEMLIFIHSFTPPGHSRQHTLSTRLSFSFQQHEAVTRITPGCCLTRSGHESAFASRPDLELDAPANQLPEFSYITRMLGQLQHRHQLLRRLP